MKHFFCLCSIIILISGLCMNKCSAQIQEKKSPRDSVNARFTNSAVLIKYPLISWARESPIEISCMLESQFGYVDSVFKCDNKFYVNKGDPCKNTREYYEGLQIPSNLVAKIHPLFKAITLSFEHGDLQDISIEFNDSISIDQVKQLFNLPTDKELYPENVMYIEYGENVTAPNKPKDPAYTRWLNIIGFDHIGAGDVDCN
jgi:hypothetical protein